MCIEKPTALNSQFVEPPGTLRERGSLRLVRADDATEQRLHFTLPGEPVWDRRWQPGALGSSRQWTPM